MKLIKIQMEDFLQKFFNKRIIKINRNYNKNKHIQKKYKNKLMRRKERKMKRNRKRLKRIDNMKIEL